ncbi:hypothetical protein ILYODFUR_036424 [Ilyodon furcidens]|uniref:Uncharacterized protein n=1 Tax=Ilyodon furcidens TaxID=33524 RepID=A0ABV0UZ68_9TELE
MHLEIGPPRSPPSSATQSPLHLSLMVPPASGGPTGGWPRISCSGFAWRVPREAAQPPGALRRLLTPGLAPGWDPGSAVPGDVTCLDFVVLMKVFLNRFVQPIT